MVSSIGLVCVLSLDITLRTFVFGIPGEFDAVDVAWSAMPVGLSSIFIVAAFKLKLAWILYLVPMSYLLVSLGLIWVLDRYSKFDKNHGLAATSILIDKGDSFESAQFHLVLNEKLALWLCPGGHIDDDRPPLLQLREKIMSETGLDIEFPPWLDLDIEDLNGSEFPSVVWASPPTFVLIEDLHPNGCTRGHSKHFDLIYIVFVRGLIAGTRGTKRYQDEASLRINVAECLGGRLQAQKAFEMARIGAGVATGGQLSVDMAERLSQAASTLQENTDLLYGNSGV